MRRSAIGWLLGAAFLGGCAAGDLQGVQAGHHPADPRAPQAPPITTGVALEPDEFDRQVTVGDSAATPEHGMEEHETPGPGVHERPAETPPADTVQAPHRHTPSSAAYVCPMHPEVTSSKPGRCDKCGMKLVERKGKR